LENFSAIKDINRAWENIKQNIGISAEGGLDLFEWKKEKPRFDKACSQFLDQRKQAKMQWLRYPHQSNVENLNNVRRETIVYIGGGGGDSE
jgi:hypothetical protein